jgi:shikimate 5-dehydrogenase
MGQGADLVINCTAGPAAPAVAAMDPGILGSGATWVDANYWMEDPPLQALCAHLGVEFHTGHSMLMHQGALSFELFTGHPVDAAQIREFMPTRIHA